MLHFINFDPARFIVDKIINGLTGRFHYHFKLGNLIDSQSQPGQRNKQIACPALEPRITGQNIRFVFLFIQKLVCSVDQTMLKSIARRTFFNLVFECFFNVRVPISETPPEKTILSPFFISTSKYPGTYRSSLNHSLSPALSDIRYPDTSQAGNETHSFCSIAYTIRDSPDTCMF